MARLLAALLLPLLVVGCLGGAHPAPEKPAEAAPVAPAGVDDGSAAVAGNASLGAKPHQHDYWKGRERVTILDKSVTFSPTNQTSLSPVFLEGRPAIGTVVVRLPDGVTVFEGTGKLELTIAWTDPDITGLIFRYKPTGVAKLSDPIPVESGKLLSIDVTPQMTDEPHAPNSAWAFILEATGPGGAGVAAGSPQLKADIIKMRAIETFPAHPDLFGGKDFVKVLDADETVKSQAPAGPAQQGNQIQEGGFPLALPVPADAKGLLVRIDVMQFTSQNPAADASSTHVGFKPANTALFWQEAPAAKRDAKIVMAKIPVAPGQGDSYYATQSQWRLWPFHEDDAGPAPLFCVVADCLAWQLDMHVTVYAYKADVGVDAFPASG